MAKIAVIGPGAIGSVAAAMLDRGGGHELTLCARSKAPEWEVTLADQTVVRERPRVLTDCGAGERVDWVLIATKAYDSEAAARWLPALMGPETRVAVLQNGVEHAQRFQGSVDPARLVAVVVDVPAERDARGRVRQRRDGTLSVAAGINGADFARLWARTSMRVEQSDDFTTVAWRKLCFNAPGALSALTLRPAEVLADEEVGALARELVRECVEVGRREGARLGDEVVEAVLAGLRRSPPDTVNSMHADRIAGRPMEIDARNGAIVRLGRRHGVATPCNAMAVTLLRATTRGATP